jgi:hypothetical protein
MISNMHRNLILPALLVCHFGVVSAQTHTYNHAPASVPSQSPVNACSMLSAQTATTLYGGPVTQADSVSAAVSAMSVCLFVNSRKSDAVSFLVQSIPQGMQKTMMDAVAKGDAKSRATPVSGIGEQAVFKVDSTSVMLAVFVRNRLVVLGVNAADSVARREAMTSVMRQILIHL